MKKKWLIPVIIICSIGLLSVICKLTGILQSYSIPTMSNEPAMRPGSRVLASNLKKPERFDFICFEQAKSERWGAGLWLMRVCGLPGDKIQIIEGTLYLNDQNADSLLDLKKEYVMHSDELKKLGEQYYRDHTDDIQQLGTDSITIKLATSVFHNKALSGRLLIRTDVDEGIEKVYGHPWNADNFGPVKVPEGHFFVMGDNRHAAADSRYTGFIDAGKYIGTVLKIQK